MNESHREVQLQGSTLSYLDLGRGPAVILAGSFLCDAGMWAPQAEFLSRSYRVIIPELWGHGRSGPMPAQTRTLADLARQHLALLDRLEIDRCSIVGLSVGGMWGAELALSAPDRVTALALLDTSLASEPADTLQAYNAMLDAIERDGAFPPYVLAAARHLFFSPTIAARRPDLPNALEQRLLAWNPARLRDSVLPLGRMIFGRRDASGELASLSMPVLVATGEDDQARPPAEGRAMAERIGCDFVTIPGAGHTASLEAPEAVNRLLRNFLDRTTQNQTL